MAAKPRRNSSTPPVPGYNVVTTLDLRLQELAEKALEAKAKRGAIVIVDPNNGDILAMASWPTLRSERFRAVDFGRKIQSIAGRSGYSAACRAPFARLIRRDRPLKSRLALLRWRAATVRSDDQYRMRPAIDIGNLLFTIGKRAIAAR